MNRQPTSLVIRNFVLFQLGWFSCVLGGASPGYAWAGLVIVTFIVLLHLAQAYSVADEAMLILVVMAAGTAWDSSLVTLGLFNFSSGSFIDGMAPLWITAMWGLFATTLNVSMKWLKGRYVLAAIFGAIGGPLAYLAGQRLGAVEFSDTTTAVIVVSAGWLVIMPALMALSERLNGYRRMALELYEAKAS